MNRTFPAMMRSFPALIMLGGGAAAVAMFAALYVYQTQPICPVRYESFYRHYYDYEAQHQSGRSKSDAIRAKAVAAAVAGAVMLLADIINTQDGPTRQMYQACVATRGFGAPESWAPHSIEEVCVGAIMHAAFKIKSGSL